MTASSSEIEVRLTAIRYAARDTNLYEFQRPDGGALPPATAGSHIDIHLPNGMMRQYSLVSAEDAPDRYIVGIRRDRASRGGSIYIHDNFRVGMSLRIAGPRNNFPLDESAPHSVLIAGGIGITPVWCMAQRLRALGKPWSMFYSSRERAEAAFLPELTKLANVTLHFDDEAAGKFLDMTAIVANAPAGAHFYCCGPLPMLAAFESATKDLPAERVHVEYFTAKEAAATEGGFVVELRRSGKEFSIPAGKSILTVLRDAGVDVTSSCEEGVCGACEVAVISGTPDHRDNVLTEAEKKASKTMMICCSGCTGERLVLDL